MPQIRCPNCGTTINLENRKETDFNIILKALQSKARSFSELLRITQLPRKTLTFRLDELCHMEAVTKDGLYYLNEACPHKEWQKKIMEVNSRMFTRKRAIALLVILCIGLPVTGNVVVAMLAPRPPLGPLGTFTATVTVNDVSESVFGWQVGLRFNSTTLKVITVSPGDFLAKGESGADEGWPFYKGTFFVHNVIENNILVICQSLLTSESNGVSGSGTLVTITFGYYETPYKDPALVFDQNQYYATMLLRKDASQILNANVTIAFSNPYPPS